MVQYLSIIRKSDFIDLFKYGHLFIHHSLPFFGKLNEHNDDKNLFDFLTSKMNLFEYSFEYLVMHFQTEENKDSTFEVQMRDVLGIYAFNSEAKKEMSISLDPRIQIHVSPWSKWFDELQKKLFINQSMRGIDNLWEVFGLNEKDKVECRNIIKDDIISEVFRQLYAYERPTGEQSLWTYLLRYERHSVYPRDMKGFFCDFIHVVCNWTSKREQHGDIVENTNVYQHLKGPKFGDFEKVVLDSPLNQLTNEATGCTFCVVAPLFLYLKSIFADGVDLTMNYNGVLGNKIVDATKENYKFNFALVTYLLGITLGFDKTYDAYYETIGLSIFKKADKNEDKVPVVAESSSKSTAHGTGVDSVVDIKSAEVKKVIETKEAPVDAENFCKSTAHGSGTDSDVDYKSTEEKKSEETQEDPGDSESLSKSAAHGSGVDSDVDNKSTEDKKGEETQKDPVDAESLSKSTAFDAGTDSDVDNKTPKEKKGKESKDPKTKSIRSKNSKVPVSTLSLNEDQPKVPNSLFPVQKSDKPITGTKGKKKKNE